MTDENERQLHRLRERIDALLGGETDLVAIQAVLEGTSTLLERDPDDGDLAHAIEEAATEIEEIRYLRPQREQRSAVVGVLEQLLPFLPARRDALAVIERIAAIQPESAVLLDQLRGAHVESDAMLVHLRPRDGAPKVGRPDGPLPGTCLVQSDDGPVGEIVVWIEAGVVSAAEYVSWSDETPGSWPSPEEVRIVPSSDG